MPTHAFCRSALCPLPLLLLSLPSHPHPHTTHTPAFTFTCDSTQAASFFGLDDCMTGGGYTSQASIFEHFPPTAPHLTQGWLKAWAGWRGDPPQADRRDRHTFLLLMCGHLTPPACAPRPLHYLPAAFPHPAPLVCGGLLGTTACETCLTLPVAYSPLPQHFLLATPACTRCPCTFPFLPCTAYPTTLPPTLSPFMPAHFWQLVTFGSKTFLGLVEKFWRQGGCVLVPMTFSVPTIAPTHTPLCSGLQFLCAFQTFMALRFLGILGCPDNGHQCGVGQGLLGQEVGLGWDRAWTAGPLPNTVSSFLPAAACLPLCERQLSVAAPTLVVCLCFLCLPPSPFCHMTFLYGLFAYMSLAVRLCPGCFPAF